MCVLNSLVLSPSHHPVLRACKNGGGKAYELFVTPMFT